MAAAQRSRPRGRRGASDPVTTTGVGVAHATSFSWTGVGASGRLAGVRGDVGVVGVVGDALAVTGAVGTGSGVTGVASDSAGTAIRAVSSSGVPGSVPGSR